MSKDRIDHQFLDRYLSVKGEFEQLPAGEREHPELWEIADQLLLDLHMLRFGYANEGYGRYVERRLKEVCSDDSVVRRMHAIR